MVRLCSRVLIGSCCVSTSVSVSVSGETMSLMATLGRVGIFFLSFSSRHIDFVDQRSVTRNMNTVVI